MKISTYLVLICTLFISLSCSKKKKQNADEPKYEVKVTQTSAPGTKLAEAKLEPLNGSKVNGEVTFKELEDGSVLYNISVTGLEPNSTHAIHIHQNGDCSAKDGSSAGGHWNPTEDEHGQLNKEHHHLGDIGNLQANDKGIAVLSGTTDLWTLSKKTSNNIRGHSIIVHAAADDFTSQPSGNAGQRVACGVIY